MLKSRQNKSYKNISGILSKVYEYTLKTYENNPFNLFMFCLFK